MPKKAMSVREAEKIAQQIAEEQNVELVDVELVKEPTGHFLRFYIEKPDGVSAPPPDGGTSPAPPQDAPAGAPAGR